VKNLDKKVEPKVQSMIGAIVDMPLKDFESELKKQKANIGTINNLILYLEAIYADLRSRKDGVLNLVFKQNHSKEEPEIKKALKGLYAEMTKIEQKVVYLKQKRENLIDLNKKVN
jgi:hypothetical protein